MLDWDHLARRANDDGEFRLHARFWNARIRIGHGDGSTRLRLVDGALTDVGPWRPADFGADLTIGADPAAWDALLAPVPKPFYHDLWAASVHHGVQLIGDSHHRCAYYPAVRRLLELMREVRHGAV
ncbi:MAG: hypothetical protein RIB46_16250 [Pseudomonadales bacterium]